MVCETIDLQNDFNIDEVFKGMGKEPSGEPSLLSGINFDSVADKASEKHNKLAERELVKSISKIEKDPEEQRNTKNLSSTCPATTPAKGLLTTSKLWASTFPQPL